VLLSTVVQIALEATTGLVGRGNDSRPRCLDLIGRRLRFAERVHSSSVGVLELEEVDRVAIGIDEPGVGIHRRSHEPSRLVSAGMTIQFINVTDSPIVNSSPAASGQSSVSGRRALTRPNTIG
jgi:hypothetical protein